MTGSVASVGYIGLAVKDIPAWEAFATNILGLQCLGTDNKGVSRLRMDQRWARFFLHPASADDLLYIGLEVADEDGLRSLQCRLKSLGVESVQGDPDLLRERRVIDLIRFEAPGGFVFEAYIGATDEPEKPVRFARTSGFVTGEQGLGHLVLRSPDAPALLRFLHEGLGFRLSDIINRPRDGGTVRAHFLHCNSRHHSLAVVPGAPDAGKLAHIMIQAQSLDDVGMALDAAHREGTEIVATLGRHTNDHMVSFYMRSPSGFAIEFGWGAIQIGEAWSVRHFDAGSIWGHHGL